MFSLKGKITSLRALEPEDLSFLYQLENDPAVWEISNTLTPYSRMVLKRYLKNSHQDIYQAKQLRLAICNHAAKLIGLIDLFDFDPKNRRAGVGIVIASAADRHKGYGQEALHLLCDYAFKKLDLHQLYASVISSNQAALKLFSKAGFEISGTKREWIYSDNSFKDEIFLQKFSSTHVHP